MLRVVSGNGKLLGCFSFLKCVFSLSGERHELCGLDIEGQKKRRSYARETKMIVWHQMKIKYRQRNVRIPIHGTSPEYRAPDRPSQNV